MIPVHNVKNITKGIHTQLPEVMNIHPHVMKLETLWEIHVSLKIPNDISTVLQSCVHVCIFGSTKQIQSGLYF